MIRASSPEHISLEGTVKMGDVLLSTFADLVSGIRNRLLVLALSSLFGEPRWWKAPYLRVGQEGGGGQI
jgi:hypothetical protein